MWRMMAVVRGRLQAARCSAFKLPGISGMDLPAVIKAMNCGKLTVALLVGEVVMKAGVEADIRRAVMLAWPLLGVLMREVMPRDTAAGFELLCIAKDAFDLGKASADPVKVVIAPILLEYSTRFGEHLGRCASLAPTWAVARDFTQSEAMRRASLSSHIGLVAPAGAGASTAAADKARAAEQLKRQQDAAELKRYQDAARAQLTPAQLAEQTRQATANRKKKEDEAAARKQKEAAAAAPGGGA
jgi:hypothetical protein